MPWLLGPRMHAHMLLDAAPMQANALLRAHTCCPVLVVGTPCRDATGLPHTGNNCERDLFNRPTVGDYLSLSCNCMYLLPGSLQASRNPLCNTLCTRVERWCWPIQPSQHAGAVILLI